MSMSPSEGVRLKADTTTAVALLDRLADIDDLSMDDVREVVSAATRLYASACTRAGLPGKLLHDLRRTAVRNMERRGVPRSAAMAMVGHPTESIYRRYAIVDEVMLKEAGDKLSSKARKVRS